MSATDIGEPWKLRVLHGDAMHAAYDLPRTPHGPEKVVELLEAASGKPRGFVVIDNLTMGPSLGGTRLAPDITVREVYGLASAMTFKNAAAMLPIGGGKSGLVGDPDYYATHPEAKQALITAFAEAIWPIKDYIPGPDMGTDEKDMQLIYDVYSRLNGSPHHGRGGVGRPPEKGGLPLDEWGLTAHGLFAAAQALEAEHPDFHIDGTRVIIQGYGNVGSPIARKLRAVGARIVGVSDIHAAWYHPEGLDLDALEHARCEATGLAGYTGPFTEQLAAEDVNRLLEMPCDMLVPAARPDAITRRNMGAIQATVILQGANNPMAPDIEAELTAKRGTLCMTDFIVNAGGVIACAVEIAMDVDPAYRARVLKEDGCGRIFMERLVYRVVSANVRDIMDRLRHAQDQTWRAAALSLARARLEAGPEVARRSLMG